MANLWTFLLVVCVSLVEISNGKESIKPHMQHSPLFNFGSSLAGDNMVTSFDQAKEIPLDFNITYFGSSYNSIYISKDGIISFVDKVRYLPGVMWSEGIRNTAADRPFMAPFYHQGYDPVSQGYASYQGHLFYRLIYAQKMETDDAKNSRFYSENKELLKYFDEYVQEAVINPPKDFKTELIAIVTWSDVTDAETQKDDSCDAHSPEKDKQCKSATFQAVIIADKEHTFAMFNYLKMDIPNEKSYQAGFNGGYERGWLNVIPCLGDCSLSDRGSSRMNTSRLNDLPNLKGSDYEGRYFLNVGGEEIVRGGCLPPELRAGTLEVYPREVGMFGGEKLQVSGKCLRATSKIYCRFGSGDKFVTEGVMTNDMKGYCPVPMMTIRGLVKLSWSSDGKDWSAGRHIAVVIPSMVDDLGRISDQERVSMHKHDNPSITVSWESDMLSANRDARVQIKLIGYRETEDEVEFKELENLGEGRNNDGSYTIDTDSHHCTRDCKDYQMGLIEVGLVKEYFGDASKRVAFRFGPMPLGWYVNKELTDSMGSDWSDTMCHKWYDENKNDKKWLKDLPKCPCSLDQALADFGRWHAHPECDLFRGSKCQFHKGAKHCVLSIQPSSDDAGNMCCYHPDGTLMYTQLTFNGGAPSRSHILGSHPFNRPGNVPEMSHMNNDVIPYIHCCYWAEPDSDLCHHFTKLRPTTDCDLYEVPGLAMVRGSTHITTFDGSTYDFGGTGDFWLLDLPEIAIQGRFKHRRGSWDLGSLRKTDKTSWKPTALTHLTIQGSGVVIRFHPAPVNAVQKRGLDILVGKNRYFFDTDASRLQEFNGDIIINNAKTMENNAHNNFTVITNNVGINVVAVNNLLHVTVALPPSMRNKGPGVKGMGLLGMFDGNHDNDYISRSNTHESPGVKPETLFKNFGMSWAVEKHESMFYLGIDPKQFLSTVQYYSYDAIPHDFDTSPTDSQISSTCEKNKNCMWDYRITGSRKVAMATKKADELFYYSQGSAYKVENCGLPAIGDMAILSSYNLSAGEEITVTGCHGDHSFDGQGNFKCIKERLEEAKDKDRLDYGRKIIDKNNVEYIVHWVPEPYSICSEEGSDDASMGMIIGIVVAVIVIILIAILIVVLVMKKRKGGSGKVQKPRPADRVRKDQDFDEGTEEPMMARDRRPVYKPSSNEPRTSSAV